MTKIQPHGLFRVWSPDEVAECLDGVDAAGLYGRLWDLIDGLPDLGETPDTRFGRSLSKVWDRLEEGEQAELNRLAVAHEASFDRA